MEKLKEFINWVLVFVTAITGIMACWGYLNGSKGLPTQIVSFVLILIVIELYIYRDGDNKRKGIYNAKGELRMGTYPELNRIGLIAFPILFLVIFILLQIISPPKSDSFPTQTSLIANGNGSPTMFSPPNTPYPTSTTVDIQMATQTTYAARQTQTAFVFNMSPTIDATKTLQPTLPLSTPVLTSTRVPQPLKVNPPAATSVPPTATNIPPSDTPLPPTPPQTTTYSLLFNSIPSAQGWTYLNGNSGIPDTEVFYVDGSQLHMNTLGRGPYGFAYQLPIAIDHQLPFTLIVRARVIAYGDQTNENPWGFTIAVIIGLEQFDLGISPGRIIGGTGTQTLSSAIDVTQFHTYRVEGQAGQGFFNVFADNILLGTAIPDSAPQQDALYLGDGTGGANAQVDIALYSFTQ